MKEKKLIVTGKDISQKRMMKKQRYKGQGRG